MRTALASLVATMVVLRIKVDAYSEVGLVQNDPDVGLHEFLGRDQEKDAPEPDSTGRVATTTAETGGPGAGRMVVDGANSDEAISLVNFWNQFQKFYEDALKKKANSGYMGEDHAEVPGAMKIRDANNASLDTNLVDGRKTTDNEEEGHRGGASMSAPSIAGAHASSRTRFDTPTNVLQRIDVHTNTRTGQHADTETRAASLKHAKEAIVHHVDDTPSVRPENPRGNPGKHGHESHNSLTSEMRVHENIRPDARPADAEVVSENNDTRDVAHLTYVTPENTTDVEILQNFESGREYGAVKTTKELEAEILTNDWENGQINISGVINNERRLTADDLAEASSANERQFRINQNTNESEMAVDNVNSTSSPLQIPAVDIFGARKSTGEHIVPPRDRRGEVRHGGTMSGTRGAHVNAVEVADNTVRAVKQLLASSKPRSLGVVVERSEDALQQATAILHSAVEGRDAPLGRALLVTYSDEVSATSCDLEDLPALVGRLTASEGPRWAALRAVEAAAERAEPGGGVLLLAGSQPSDKNLFYPVIRALGDKRLELHVVWCGPKAAAAEGSLRDLSWYSGGSFHIAGSVGNETADGHPPHLVTLVVQKGLTGGSEVEIPVDSSLRAVHVDIRGPVKTAVLYDPAGRPTNLLPTGAATLSDDDSLLEARLNTSGAAPGRWTLAVVGAGAASYDVTVRGPSTLDFAAERDKDGVVRLRGAADAEAVDEVSALDRLGREVARLHYTRTTPSQLAVADDQLLPSAASYLRVSGADTNGVAFQRVSYLSQQITAGTSSPIELEVAPNSTLSALPGQVAQIIYTVTNNQEVTNYIDFRCSSQHFSISVQPQSFALAAHQTIYILGTVRVPQNTPLSTKDIITMTAVYGPNSGISNIAYFTVGREVSDNEKPTINYRVDSECGSTDTSDCRLKTWRVELIAQDKQSGLLQVTSQPKGLRLRSTFVAGTTDLVTAYYSATCCDPSLVVTATDTSNNYATQTITATPTVQLSAAATAGIVIGVLLFIIIIIIAAVLVVRRRRRRQSVSFPQSTDR